jgi:hypothetical protein
MTNLAQVDLSRPLRTSAKRFAAAHQVVIVKSPTTGSAAKLLAQAKVHNVGGAGSRCLGRVALVPQSTTSGWCCIPAPTH